MSVMPASPVAARAPGRPLSGGLIPVLATALSLVLAACAGGARPSATAQASASAAAPSVAATPEPLPSGEPSSSSSFAAPSESPSGTILLYTSVQQTTIDPVLAAFAEAHPDVTVDLFRAPTGELTARIAADVRDQGRIGGDVLWLSDPLSAQQYDDAGHLRAFEPPSAAALDEAYVADTYWGTRLLNMVLVAATDAATKPTGWQDLTGHAFHDAVALPDPAFAGSAFGALGYFAQAPGFGLDWYRALAANGATQLQAPDEVTTGVAEGRFTAGMTLDFSARAAAQNGSPVELIWPAEGAVAIHSPAAVVDATANGAAAEAFVDFLLSESGQSAIAGTGWQPVLAGAGGPEPGGEQVAPDWARAAGQQEQLLEDYAAIFGG